MTMPPGTPGSISARVVAVESTGTAMFVATKSGDLAVNALFMDRPPITKGDAIALRPRPGLSHLFDATSLQRLPL